MILIGESCCGRQKFSSAAVFVLSPHTYQGKQSGNFTSLLYLSPKCNISWPMDYFEFSNVCFCL